jgi:hypothetical protein
MLCAPAARAEIAVEIINMPTEAYSFGPVYVLYAVQNNGPAPAYLPAECWPDHGPDIFYAKAGEIPHPPLGRPVAASVWDGATSTMWLAPGERWLFYQDIGQELGVLEGTMSVQAVMSSDGRCGERQVGGRHTYPLAPLHVEASRVGTARFETYRCWEGEVRSSVWEVTIKRPLAPIDQEAARFLLQQRGVGLYHDVESGLWRLQWAPGLYEKFPASQYTYALMARGGGTRAMELQPENPLNSWLRGLLARQSLEMRSSCSKQKDRSPDLDIAKLELPTGVREYLDQYAWYLENLHCPRVVKESRAKGAAKP